MVEEGGGPEALLEGGGRSPEALLAVEGERRERGNPWCCGCKEKNEEGGEKRAQFIPHRRGLGAEGSGLRSGAAVGTRGDS